MRNIVIFNPKPTVIYLTFPEFGGVISERAKYTFRFVDVQTDFSHDTPMEPIFGRMRHSTHFLLNISWTEVVRQIFASLLSSLFLESPFADESLAELHPSNARKKGIVQKKR